MVPILSQPRNSNLPKDDVARIDKLQETFKEVQIPVQVLKTEDRSIVAIVFERVNRLGMALESLKSKTRSRLVKFFRMVLLFKDSIERGRLTQPTLLPSRPCYP
jgi:hypothetical protein